MKKLISMVAFVLQETKLWSGNEYESYEIAKSCLKYAQFLIQKLELWMFIPCKLVDGVWVALEEPKRWNDYLEYPESFDGNKEWYEFYEYEQAKERCLFEDFTVKNGIVFTPDNQILIQKSLLEKMTIENLVGLKCELTITAQKQIGICQ